jgi:hypothetical protein
VRLRALALAAAALMLGAASRQLPVQTPDRLAPVAFLAGGTWRGTGRWPDGTPLRDEVRYFWGPTRRTLHFESYDLTNGERRLLYEGWILFDPAKGKLVQWNVKPTGEIDVREFGQADSTGFEVIGPNTRSVVRRAGPDTFTWELRVPKDGQWNVILEATYRR